MSLKNSYTTSDYLQWDSATNLVRRLYRDKNYRISGQRIFALTIPITEIDEKVGLNSLYKPEHRYREYFFRYTLKIFSFLT